MAEHLTLVTLRRALSARAGVSEKVADDFLSALFVSIQEGLNKNGKVTINGLGTFKLQELPARESVNVVTGERITIAGYKKVVFEVEKKSAGKAAVEVDDPIRKLGEQAEEIKGILSELNAMSADVLNTMESTTDSTPTPEPKPTPTPTPEPKPTPTPTPEPVPQQPKPFNPWLTGLITIGVFTMLLVVAYFILRHQIISWADNMRTSIEQRVNTQPAEPTNAVELDMSTDAPEQPEAEEQEPSTESTDQTEATEQTEVKNPLFDDSKRTFTEFQAEETVGKDSRLAWIAKKRYGEKALWVFIYEANRDRLKNPDQVLPGMQLRIPKLPAELRDVNNPDTKALLDRLSEKYLN